MFILRHPEYLSDNDEDVRLPDNLMKVVGEREFSICSTCCSNTSTGLQIYHSRTSTFKELKERINALPAALRTVK